jgi:hypothetical protein
MADEEKPAREKSDASTSKSVNNLVAVIGAITALVATNARKTDHSFGSSQSATPQPPFAINGRTVVNVKCVGEHGSLIFQLSYNSSGKIAGLWRRPIPN